MGVSRKINYSITQGVCHGYVFFADCGGANDEIQLDLFLSYGSNPPLYLKWQAYFRKHQPPMLIAWGKNDKIFPAAGAEPYKFDLKTLEFHLLDAGHFALESNGDEIAALMRDFLGKHVAGK